MKPDARMARLLAEMDRADAELRAEAARLSAPDGLLDPALDGVFARLGDRARNLQAALRTRRCGR